MYVMYVHVDFFQHLDKEDPEIVAIIETLIKALATPSESVQRAVADCLTPLVQVPVCMYVCIHFVFMYVCMYENICMPAVICINVRKTTFFCDFMRSVLQCGDFLSSCSSVCMYECVC